MTELKRETAVRALCDALCGQIHRDGELIEQVIARCSELDAQPDDELIRQAESLEAKIILLDRRLADLYDLVGCGGETERQQVKSHIQACQTDRHAARRQLTHLRRSLDRTSTSISEQDVRRILMEFATLLEDAVAGQLGDDAVYKALAVFRRLTGGCIMVVSETRIERKRTIARGVFNLQLVRAIREHAGHAGVDSNLDGMEVTVWLRKPPRLDMLAERAHQLVDVDGLSLRAAATRLQLEGHTVNSGNVWYSHRRWYEMNGLPPPKLQRGRPRRPK
jgi:hypothetical protein